MLLLVYRPASVLSVRKKATVRQGGGGAAGAMRGGRRRDVQAKAVLVYYAVRLSHKGQIKATYKKERTQVCQLPHVSVIVIRRDRTSLFLMYTMICIIQIPQRSRL